MSHNGILMNPEVKADWLKALRSGEYKQARHCMYDYPTDLKDPHFCCLGVLCEVVAEKRGTVLPVTSQHAARWGGDVGDTHVFLLNIGVRNHMDKLITMNDRQEMSFKEIADWIEKNL